MHQQLLSRLDSLVISWKEQFDEKPHLSFYWSHDHNHLSLNGKKICPIDDIVFRKETFGVEYLRLVLKDGWVDIVIDWPHQGDAYLSELIFHKSLA